MEEFIIDLNNEERIKQLNTKEFAIPRLNWEVEIPLLIGQNTLDSMATNMRNKNCHDIISYANEKLQNNISIDGLENLIQQEIKYYLDLDNENKKNEKIIIIFHLIQLWGGNAGRMFYFMNMPINFYEYKELILFSLNENEPEKVLIELKKFIKSKKNNYINIAFMTKHISLWQRFGTNFKNPLPIYDSIIAKNIMGIVTFDKKRKKWNGFTNNDWSSLLIYWKQMQEISKYLNVTTCQIERQIFNHFRNQDWTRNYGN